MFTTLNRHLTMVSCSAAQRIASPETVECAAILAEGPLAFPAVWGDQLDAAFVERLAKPVAVGRFAMPPPRHLAGASFVDQRSAIAALKSAQPSPGDVIRVSNDLHP